MFDCEFVLKVHYYTCCNGGRLGSIIVEPTSSLLLYIQKISWCTSIIIGVAAYSLHRALATRQRQDSRLHRDARNFAHATRPTNFVSRCEILSSKCMECYHRNPLHLKSNNLLKNGSINLGIIWIYWTVFSRHTFLWTGSKIYVPVAIRSHLYFWYALGPLSTGGSQKWVVRIRWSVCSCWVLLLFSFALVPFVKAIVFRRCPQEHKLFLRDPVISRGQRVELNLHSNVLISIKWDSLVGMESYAKTSHKSTVSSAMNDGKRRN